MSQASGRVRCWVLIGAMALAAPAMASQLASNVIVNEIAPFRALNSSGGLCNSAQAPGGNPVIQIDNSGFDELAVTGILIKTSGIVAGSVVSLSIDSVAINGVRFDTRTESLVGPTDGSAVFESVDLMGALVRRGGRRVSWKGGSAKGKLRVGGKTKITVGGNKAKRGALKVGMSCTFTVKGAQRAMKIDCG